MPVRFKHQASVFEETKDMVAFAYYWEVRCGKTYPNLDTARYWWEQKRIDTVMVWTTNGNHLKWATKHIPNYLKEMGMGPESRILAWVSDKSKSDKYKKEMKDCLAHPGLLWFCINFEALPLDRVEIYIETLLAQRTAFLLIDESHRLKTPDAEATRAALRLAPDTKARRILTGSPSPKNPFDLWSQFQILDPKILNERFTSFKQHFGIWKRLKFGARAFDALDVEKGERGFKNLDVLYDTIKPFTSRLLKKDVFDDLPKEEYKRVTFQLSDKQHKAFSDLRDEQMTILESGQTVTAVQALTCVVRMQQISRGFIGQTDDDPIDIGGPYPALEALGEELDKIFFDFRLGRKVLIWCRFTADVDMVLKYLAKEGYGKFVRYDGKVSVQQREANVELLQNDPTVRGLVGNPAAPTEGQNMSAAYAKIYYSYSYKLIEREQSWGRNDGPDQKEKSILAVDIVAENTFDDEILANLAAKQDLSAIITGDKLREMLKKTVV